MIILGKNKVKLVGMGIVLFVAVPPLVLAGLESRPITAAGMLIMGLIMLATVGSYMVWTAFLTRVEIADSTLIVTTPYSVRSFRLPEDIKEVIDDRRDFGHENLAVHFGNGKDRFVFTVNRFVMDSSDNRLTQILNELRIQVQKTKAAEPNG